MMALAGSAEVARFRDVVATRLGLRFDDARLSFLGDVLDRRLAATRLDPGVYLDRLAGGQVAGEAQALAAELTVPETYFFRNRDQFRALADVVLPDRMAARGSHRRLRLLSAGCATGEEAYSIAMTARDVVPAGWTVDVRGIDLNPDVIARARRGRYPAWSLRETSSDLARQWFTREGREHVLREPVRSAVQFSIANLAADDPVVWAPAVYDVVFVRNVLMYFTTAQARAALARIERALVPGGYLFLGHAETLHGWSSSFALRHTHGTFYYQREGAPAAPGVTEPPPRWTPAGADLTGLAETGWVDAIQAAAARVETLGTARPAAPRPKAAAPPVPLLPPVPPPSPADAGHAWSLDEARALLQGERYTEAAAALDRLSPEASADPAALILRAAVETHRGRLDDAEAACHRVLAADPFDAGAHYLLAMCREAAGDLAAAEHHDQVAIYLDPGFAMAHLHAGLLARRRGDVRGAGRLLDQAIVLFGREDEARLLLFGGGFGRESLVALCRTERERLGRAR
jgi:chemotaxis protein methyltransferase CheR